MARGAATTPALTEARRYEETVSHTLGERVFAEVFPDLANALAASDLHANKDGDGCYSRAYLDELREGALVLLYRLLFVLYAEDRALLPVRDARYQDYGLTALRDEIAGSASAKQKSPTTSAPKCSR